MKPQRSRACGKRVSLLLLAWAAICGVLAPASAHATDAVIGVLGYRGRQNAIQRWQATADYLSQRVHGYHFRIQPLTLEGMRQATAAGQLDFVLTNPGDYVDLEARYGISRLVTLRNLRGGNAYTKFGAVIFTRADRNDIKSLQDLKGKSFMAVSKNAFGGFQLAWLTLLQHGVDPFTDFSRLVFNGFPQDDIVYAVRDGKVDAGTVRTDIIERMAAESKIDIRTFRVLASRVTPGFPFRHSTALYPEWPFAKTNRTSDRLAQRVAVALLTMPEDHRAAKAGHYAGWTVPLDYHRVHDLFRQLGIGPYYRPLTLRVMLQAYWRWIVGAIVAILLMATVTAYVLGLNRRLKHSTLSLERALRQRRRAETETQKLSSALQQSADLVIITDRDGVIEYVNPTFEHVTGFSREETVGRKPNLVKSGMHNRQFYATLWKTVLSGEPYHAVFTNQRKDGSVYYEEKTVTPLRDESGTVQYFVSTGKDITDRILSEERARQHEAQLAHVARVSTMGEMASALAHELNQPLAAIVNYARGCVRRLQSGTGDPVSLTEALENIAAQGQRSGEIIRRLRTFLRKSELRRNPAQINEIATEAASLAELEARHRRVELRLELCDGLPPLLADGIQVEQVILNLVRNAMEAIDTARSRKREVVLRTGLSPSGDLEVAVEDSGPGLRAGDTDRLFEAFFTTKEEGMGMGLSISRSIIEAHGGRLYAHPRNGGGAVFGFTLPALDENNAITKRTHDIRR